MVERRTTVLVAVLITVVSATAGVSVAIASATTAGPPAGTQSTDFGAGAATLSLQSSSGLTSGGEYWRGVRLRFDGTNVVPEPGDAPESARSFSLWRVSADGKLVERVRRFAIDTDGIATIRTADFTGRVVITYHDRPVLVRDGVGYLSSPDDGSRPTIENSSWRVTRQSLESGWADHEVDDGQTTTLRIDSDRASYDVAITSDDLSTAGIERIFRQAGVDVSVADDAVILESEARTRVPVNFTGVPPGHYLFRVDVVDTTASSTSAVRVNRPGGTRMSRIERVDHTGDYLTTTISCGRCYLFVGGPGQGLLDLVEVRDENGDGSITVDVNTRYAGLRSAAVPSSVDVYRAGADTARRFSPSDGVAPDDVNLQYGLGRVRSNIGLDAAGRRTPVPAGTYDLTVASSREVSLHPTYEILGERHVQSVRLTEPSLGNVRTGVLADDVSGGLTLGSVSENTHWRDEISVGDDLVLGINVSGVSGHVVGAHGGRLRAIIDNRGEGLDLAFRGPSRRHPLDSRARLFVDEAEKRLYVVVDTSALRIDRPIEDGRSFRATFSIDGAAYPYRSAGEDESAAAAATFVEPAAEIAALATDRERISVAGQSNLAPGSIVSVQVSATEPYSWSTAKAVVVGPDGLWNADLDVGPAPGDRFSVRVVDDDEQLSGVQRVTLRSDSTPTASPATTTEPRTTMEPETATTTMTDADPGTETETEPGTATATIDDTETETETTQTTATETRVTTTTDTPETVTTRPRSPTTTASSGPTQTAGPPTRTPATDGDGLAFAPAIPQLPTVVAWGLLAVVVGSVGGVAFLVLRP